ncbi:MAG TPA: hypothetical protein VGM33_12745 [Baekduia sp.]
MSAQTRREPVIEPQVTGASRARMSARWVRACSTAPARARPSAKPGDRAGQRRGDVVHRLAALPGAEAGQGQRAVDGDGRAAGARVARIPRADQRQPAAADVGTPAAAQSLVAACQHRGRRVRVRSVEEEISGVVGQQREAWLVGVAAAQVARTRQLA